MPQVPRVRKSREGAGPQVTRFPTVGHVTHSETFITQPLPTTYLQLLVNAR